MKTYEMVWILDNSGFVLEASKQVKAASEKEALDFFESNPVRYPSHVQCVKKELRIA